MELENRKSYKKALILDRDGIICKALDGYLLDINDFEIVPGISNLIRNAKEKGYEVLVATNQAAVGKGLLSKDDLEAMHRLMHEYLGGEIKSVYYCPHRDEDNCVCRKPKPGMLHAMANDHGIDLSQSIMVGDREKDILAGQLAGCGRTVFVKNSINEHTLALCEPDHVVDSVLEITEFL